MAREKGEKTALWPVPLDHLVGGGVLVFVGLISLFAIRNNDVWWHLGIGREIIRTGRFITSDPFMFSVPNTPWVPHAWLSDIIFYITHAVLSAPGLVVLRALLVCSTFLVMARLIRRLKIPITLAAPVILLVALSAHSRFIVRPHLFEYLFIVLLLGYLISRRDWTGYRFLIFPVALQILWVNLHASFYFGVGIVVMFFVGEWLSAKLTGALKTRPVRTGPLVPLKQVALLVVTMTAASFINPSPIEYVLQPLNPEQRELLTAYTLEWRSPFDPAMKNAAFHPYYELLLVLTGVAFFWSINRLKLASLLIVGVFTAMSLQAHRFRVEFALVALPLILDTLRDAPLTGKVRRWLTRKGRAAQLTPYVFCVVASVLLIFPARDRIQFDGAVSDRFPQGAFRFVRGEGVAKRSFHSVGFGSYLIWDLFPDRQTFIDGRNIDANLHREFIASQRSSVGFNALIRKYDLDGFIVPAPERSDGGMTNIHKFLIDANGWALAYMDRVAYVYVKKKKVDPDWLARNAYRFYHPMNFQQLRVSQAQVDSLQSEFARAVDTDALYLRPLLDNARFQAALGDLGAAIETVERAISIDPDNPEAARLLRSLSGP